jgi:lysophospholipase L1-like esterase
MSNAYTYLALGDSYTIGESVAIHETFPYQAVQILRNAGKNFTAPRIIAQTGWTTADLIAQLDRVILNTAYDFVTLLIGVNNQYRGFAATEYELEFSTLLLRAISLAPDTKHVIVLSIPDWSETPFATGRDRQKISADIALYNRINHSISKTQNCTYIDVGAHPIMGADFTFIASDGLHPSPREYRRWAKMVAENILNVLQAKIN